MQGSTGNTVVYTILVLAANPRDQKKLKLKTEVKAIKDGVRRFNDGSQFKVESVWETQTIEIHRAIDEYQPQIIHFCGHGSQSEGLVFTDEHEKSQPINGKALARLFDDKFTQKHLECVVLNACYSDSQSDEISKYVDYVVGVTNRVSDKTAITFSIGLYESLSAGRTFEDAFKRSLAIVGCVEDSSQYFELKKKNSHQVIQKNLLI